MIEFIVDWLLVDVVGFFTWSLFLLDYKWVHISRRVDGT